MSAKSENRYKKFCRQQADYLLASHNQRFINDLNALPKHADARAPWGDCVLVHGNNGWWLECIATGYGYHYPTIRAAVKSWRVHLMLDGKIIRAVPT